MQPRANAVRLRWLRLLLRLILCGREENSRGGGGDGNRRASSGRLIRIPAHVRTRDGGHSAGRCDRGTHHRAEIRERRGRRRRRCNVKARRGRCGRRRVRARPLRRRGSARWLRRVRIRANATYQRGRKIVTATQGSTQILSLRHLFSGEKAVGCNIKCTFRAVKMRGP